MLTVGKAVPSAARIFTSGVADRYAAPPPSPGRSIVSTRTGMAVLTLFVMIDHTKKFNAFSSLDPVKSVAF